MAPQPQLPGLHPAIEDYAMVGDCQTAALVSRSGSVDWMCLPRFDSPACFAKMVGTEANGYWEICPDVPVGKVTRRYWPDTLVLETTFHTSAGSVRVVDAMPPREGRPRFFRLVEGLAGKVPMRMNLRAAFDYGALSPLVSATGRQVVLTAGPDSLRLWSARELEVSRHAVAATFCVVAREQVGFELAWHPSHEDPPPPIVGQAALEAVQAFWQLWAAESTYDGMYKDAVTRSLITLKALTYAPTGGMVAAPTTSLPEYVGGARNWDYRYCWVRDSALALGAFMRCGYHEEATAWWRWLGRAAAGDPGRLKVLYSVTGERHVPERKLTHLSGYASSLPVRCGNAAIGQAQTDLYGELANAFHLYRTLLAQLGRNPAPAWDHELSLAEYLASTWRRPDRSIWEVRDRSRHFTYSKVMAWVALDRAIKDAEAYNLMAPLNSWRRARQAVFDEVVTKGFDYDRGHFTMAYDLGALDAALLLIPVYGFLPAEDPRVVRTVDAIAAELDADGFIRRYRPGAPGPKDAEMGDEGVFLPCSFWMVDALAMIGRTGEAESRLDHLLSITNDVGLLAEEYDPKSGHHLGNFPQAFSHVALIESICLLEDAERRRRSGAVGVSFDPAGGDYALLAGMAEPRLTPAAEQSAEVYSGTVPAARLLPPNMPAPDAHLRPVVPADGVPADEPPPLRVAQDSARQAA